MPPEEHLSPEWRRLEEDRGRRKNWKRWGPYLSERQWGTVREDYSPDGNCWGYFTHDQARSRAYRWGEDGLLGIADRECRLCFALALWNGRDPILKERLFGLTNPEGNHGEDVKECYFYLDSTPTHSYLKALYKYPQAGYPYDWLVAENARRSRSEPEFELLDTGAFHEGRYFDVFAEYAKAAPDDILIRLTAANRGPEAANLDLLATLWFRNHWFSGNRQEPWPRPNLSAAQAARGGGPPAAILADHATLGKFRLLAGAGPEGNPPELLFTENETNALRLFGAPNPTPYVKDAFNEYVVHGRKDAVNPQGVGTKAAGLYRLQIKPGEAVTLRLRLSAEEESPADPLGGGFDQVFSARLAEADQFYRDVIPPHVPPEMRLVTRQAYAGLLWSRQFYYYVVQDWLKGDPALPAPSPQRQAGRNHEWEHIFNRNCLCVPDKWEFPWYAAWDLAFQMLPLARVDPDSAKEQLVVLLREWFMHPNGQLPAYELGFSDVNPPVHAWACWRVYKIAAAKGHRDRAFLARTFQKLLLNFTWWVNRKDVAGKQVFSGGFLGMDNIGIFDRSAPCPKDDQIQQADGTAWMASYCLSMLSMALELAAEDPVYEDTASKFLQHFTAISDAINNLGGTGLWNEEDGFYYDVATDGGRPVQLRVRSMVGLIPLIAVAVLDDAVIGRLPGFMNRLEWFLEHRKDLASQVSYLTRCADGRERRLRLLAIPSRERLERVLAYVLDEKEFLSPHGIRSLSMAHREHPAVVNLGGREHRVGYEPGESTTSLFGGNSNWRGPVWMPINYLLIEALERYHYFYGDTLQVECPTGSGRRMNLGQVAGEIQSRVRSIFLPGPDGRRPWQGPADVFHLDAHWKDLTLFHEYFHGDTGAGLGASHQTGWTALIARLMEDCGRQPH